jgi:hypothetical protein
MGAWCVCTGIRLSGEGNVGIGLQGWAGIYYEL